MSLYKTKNLYIYLNIYFDNSKHNLLLKCYYNPRTTQHVF